MYSPVVADLVPTIDIGYQVVVGLVAAIGTHWALVPGSVAAVVVGLVAAIPGSDNGYQAW